jgi:hypothetical protein
VQFPVDVCQCHSSIGNMADEADFFALLIANERIGRALDILGDPYQRNKYVLSFMSEGGSGNLAGSAGTATAVWSSSSSSSSSSTRSSTNSTLTRRTWNQCFSYLCILPAGTIMPSPSCSKTCSEGPPTLRRWVTVWLSQQRPPITRQHAEQAGR